MVVTNTLLVHHVNLYVNFYCLRFLAFLICQFHNHSCFGFAKITLTILCRRECVYGKNAGPLPPPPEVINHDNAVAEQNLKNLNAEKQSTSSESVSSLSFYLWSFLRMGKTSMSGFTITLGKFYCTLRRH